MRGYTKGEDAMKCKVCGFKISGKYSKCRKCGTIDWPMSFWRKMNLLGRITDLELQNQKQAAVIMKQWKKIEEKEKPSSEEERFSPEIQSVIDELLQKSREES